MTVEEAEKLLIYDKTTKKIDRVSESTNYYIFNIIPINSDKILRPMVASVAIEKKSGKRLAFNPLRIPKDELKSIKRIR